MGIPFSSIFFVVKKPLNCRFKFFIMKTAIITGATGNLGHAVIQKFLAENFKVIGTVIPNDSIPLDIEHANFEKQVIDLGNEQAVRGLITSIIEKDKQIDAAILTVGGFAMANIEETSAADIEKQLKLNFYTAYAMAKPVFLQMMKQGFGRIFLIGSRPGSDMHQSKGMVAYGLSKSLVFRLAELMNDEAKGHNVVVSVVVPSTIDTPQNRASMPKADFKKWVQPEAIAEVIYFYCTDESSVLREPIIKVYNNA